MEKGAWTLEEGSRKRQACAHPGRCISHGNTAHAPQLGSHCSGWSAEPRGRGMQKAPSLWQKDEFPWLVTSLSVLLLFNSVEPANTDFPWQNAWVRRLGCLCLWLFHLLGHKAPGVIMGLFGNSDTQSQSTGREGSFANLHHLYLVTFQWKRIYSISKVKTTQYLQTALPSDIWTLWFNYYQGACIWNYPGSSWLGEADLERGTQYYFGKVLIIRGYYFFLFAIRFSASVISFFLWHLWLNCKTFIYIL